MPVYNTERWLRECIDSILKQSFTDFELLLIDDGSSDSSGKICDHYTKIDQRIRVFHQSNQGASAARNRGIDHSRGKWICFIDSDDYIGENYLLAFFEQGWLSEDCLNMQGWKTVSDINGKILTDTTYPDVLANVENMKEIFRRHNFLSNSVPWGKLFNKKLIDRIGLSFRIDLSVREDAVFVYTYRTHVSAVRLIPVSEYYYRQAFRRRTLCSQNHHYETFLTIRQLLPPLVEQTLRQWKLQDTANARQVVSYYKGKTCLSIVKSLYAWRTDHRKRIAVLHTVFDDRSYFRDPLFHISPLLQLFRIGCRLLPVTLFDFLLNLLFSCYYRYIRKVRYSDTKRG